MTITVDYNDVADYLTDGVIRTYSGRGMYGRYCMGLETDGRGIDDLITFTQNIAEDILCNFDTPEEAPLWDFYNNLSNVSVDNMGMGMIYYWTNVEVVNVPKHEDW